MGELARLLEEARNSMPSGYAMYTISYDLHGDDADYPELWTFLGELRAIQHTKSTYFFTCQRVKLTTLCRIMRRHVGDDDSFVISEVNEYITVNC